MGMMKQFYPKQYMRNVLLVLLLNLGTFYASHGQNKTLVFISKQGTVAPIDTAKFWRVVTSEKVHRGAITYFDAQILVVKNDTIPISEITKITRNSWGIVPASCCYAKAGYSLVSGAGDLVSPSSVSVEFPLFFVVLPAAIGTIIHFASRTVYHSKRGKIVVLGKGHLEL